MYQNEAHKRATKIRAKYDPDYIKNDPYDYTHGGLYDPDRMEPMAGPPKYEVWTRLPGDENQDKNASDEESEATPGELLTAVLTPEQLSVLNASKDSVLSLLTKEEKNRVEDEKSFFSVIDELDSEKQLKIEKLAQGIYDSLSTEQKRDLIFLGSPITFAGESLNSRLAILQWMNENHRDITYEDLVKMGLYAQGELEDAGREWAHTINLNYDLVYRKDSSIDAMDKEQKLRDGMVHTARYDSCAAC